MASDSVTEEVANHTWDVHRLSAQSATGLVLGKFAGGTIYSWYGAAIALGIAWYANPASLNQIAELCLTGLFAQAFAFFIALILRGGSSSRRIQNLIAQLAGLSAAVCIGKLPALLTTVGVEITWYGHLYRTQDFVDVLSGIGIVWLLIGGIRIVRRDLGSRDGPLGWIAFSVCLAAFVYGFSPHFAAAFASLSLPPDPDQTRKMLYVSVVAFYAALIGNPGGYNRIARLYRHFASDRWPLAWRDTLPWMAAYGLCVAAAIYTALTSGSDALFSFAALGFLLRDAIVIMGLRLRNHGRGSIAIFYFLVVWLIGPYATLHREVDFVFLPTSNTLSIACGWGEAIAALLLLRGAFVNLARSARPTPVDAL